MQIPRALSLIVLLFCGTGVIAADVDDLFSARVPVADRSDTEFKRGIARALEAVVVKLTGNSATAKTKPARAVVGRAKHLVQQFGYERPRGTRPGVPELMLRVQFDPRVTTEEMRKRNLVVWGKERPDTLVWLIVDDATGPRLLGSQDPHPVVAAVRARAAARGIPVLFPLGDITETSAVNAADGVARDTALQEISERYGVQAMLVGHLSQALPTLWESRWRLTVAGESMSWQQAGELIELLGEEASETLADALGRRYASPAVHSRADTVTLTVRSLNSARDYARTERYLSTLDSVTGLAVRRVDVSGIVFDLHVQGGDAALRQGISFGNVMSVDPLDPNVFHLTPR